jgi:hypothetical protein
MISVETLRQLLRLDPETGKLYWLPRGPEWFAGGKYPADRLARMWNAQYAGRQALTCHHGPYRAGRIFRRMYLAHVVIFALANGRWPIGDVDHKDTDKSNDRPDNLREATRQQNMRNSGARGGTSKFCGVSWHAGGRKWIASCADDTGKRRHLGLFAEESAAARAYDAAARQWHGEFARLNFPTAAREAFRASA